MKLEVHEVANLFPLMSSEEFEALKADVKTNGLREPVWLWQSKVIDGRNRLRACQEAGIEPRFREWDGIGSLVAFVLSLNLHRRHLTSSQRAAIAAEIEPLLAEEAKERQRQAGKEHGRGHPKEKLPQIVAEANGEAREEAARLSHTNRQYVSTAKRVKEQAPELHEKVKAGEMTLPQAARQIDREAKRDELERKAKASLSSPSREPSWQIIQGDSLKELCLLPVEQSHLIFADPPYNIGVDYGDGASADRLSDTDFVKWCHDWLLLCRERLTPDGTLWLLIGDEYADYLGVTLRDVGFHRRAWIKWYETFGVCNSSGKNFSRCSRHLFYYVKNRDSFTWHESAVTRPSDRQAKYHDARANPGGKVWDDVWEIPRLVGTAEERIPDFPTQLPLALLRPIIGATSNPGDLVVDPFCGSASTGVAALEAGRRFIGIEKQKHFARLATLRLKGVPCEVR